MSITATSTRNLYAEPDLLHIFSAQGSRHIRRHWRFWTRISWWCNTYDTTECWIYLPTSMLPKIDELIESDRVAGKDHRIRMLQVDPYQAVILYLEGVMTFEHASAAVQHDDYIDIPGVEISGRCLTIRVTRRVRGLATLDMDGNVL